MVIYYIVFLLCLLWGASKRRGGDLLDQSQTYAINGFMICLVVFRHIISRLVRHGYFAHELAVSCRWDGWAYRIDGLMFQLLVVTFLFYSGYGIVEQIKRKGAKYIDDIPSRRILSTYLNFAIAICAFCAVHFVFSSGVPIKRMLASFIFIRQIDNPAWYICCIMWCYLGTYIAALLVKKNIHAGGGYGGVWFVVFNFVFDALFVVIMSTVRPNESKWFNTIFAYTFGVFVSTYRERSVKFIDKFSLPLFLGSLIACLVLSQISLEWLGIKHNLMGICFMVLILVSTSKVRFGNRFVCWLGKSLFPIYMYHMLLLLVWKCCWKAEVSEYTSHLIIISTFGFSLIVARLYHFWQIRITYREGIAK